MGGVDGVAVASDAAVAGHGPGAAKIMRYMPLMFLVFLYNLFLRPGALLTVSTC